jgi:hypothetical protein
MVRGINNTELIKWLQEVRAFAPAELLTALLSIIEQELSTERFDRVMRGLNKPAVVL